MAARIHGLARHAGWMLGADAVGLGKARGLRRLVPRRGRRRAVVVALVGHGDYCFVLVELSVLEVDEGVLGGVVEDAVLSGFVLLEPLGVDETLPFADIDAEVEVSVDGVLAELELLLGEDVSVEAVVVGGVATTVVEVVDEPGVALVPELL